MHHHSKEGKQALGLHQAEHCQQVEEGNSSPLLSPADTVTGYCNSLQDKRDGKESRERPLRLLELTHPCGITQPGLGG